MCRLLAYVAPQPLSLRNAVQEPTFATFRELSRVHCDGWGIAWLDPHAPERGSGVVGVRRSITCAADDREFDAVAADVTARAAIAHLRWATEGLAVTPANTHPFVGDGWAFAHNGFVRRSDALERLLSDRNRAAVAGTTDSERYFRFVLQCAERSGDMVTGIQQAAATIRETSGAVSINAMLLSASRLLAVQGLAGAIPPRDDLLALGDDPRRLPADHLDGYFRLFLRDRRDANRGNRNGNGNETDGDASGDGDALVIASSGVLRDGWIELPSDAVTDVNIATRDWTLHPLLDPLPADAGSAPGAAAPTAAAASASTGPGRQ
jgi:predicted glutamine amidotransferase